MLSKLSSTASLSVLKTLVLILRLSLPLGGDGDGGPAVWAARLEVGGFPSQHSRSPETYPHTTPLENLSGLAPGIFLMMLYNNSISSLMFT